MELIFENEFRNPVLISGYSFNNFKILRESDGEKLYFKFKFYSELCHLLFVSFQILFVVNLHKIDSNE